MMSTLNTDVDLARARQADEKANKAYGEKLKHLKEDIPWTLGNAITKGGWKTKVSMLIMGFGNILHGQIVKGLAWLATQIFFIVYMINYGVESLMLFPTLGWLEPVEVWNEQTMVYEYTPGHNSVLILLWGIISVAFIVLFFYVWKSSVQSAYKAEFVKKEGFKPNTLVEDIKGLLDERIGQFLLSLPLTGTIVFSILPLLFMMLMAFTSYSAENNQLLLFDWVGFDNFGRGLSTTNSIGRSFWPVLGWTLIWAFFATVLNFFLGIGLALLINRNRTRAKALWRTAFTLTIAVPQFISLLVVRQMLSRTGPVNLWLINSGLIDSALPFWSNANWARVTVIVVNIWVGIPYTLLQVTGILQNFPEEYWEAAKIDGANAWQQFRHITFPHILQIMGPFLITQFTGNVNNFNVIFLLTGGGPPRAGSTAGYTDLLVTWLYSLTIDNRFYNIGAVVGILTFIALSIVALSLYRFTDTYKREKR